MELKTFKYNNKDRELIVIKEIVTNGKEYVEGVDLAYVENEAERNSLREVAPYLTIVKNKHTLMDYIADSRVIEGTEPGPDFPPNQNFGSYPNFESFLGYYRRFEKAKME